MSYADIDICNMALGHLKIAKQVASLLTDRSAETSACNLFYPTCKATVLKAVKWPFAKNIVSLALLQTSPFPDVNGNVEWSFAYQYPADAANVVRLLSGIRNDSRQSRIPYKIFANATGKMILTDMENAQCEYTVNVSEANFDADLALAMSYKLAMMMAPLLTGGDPFKLGDAAEKKYIAAISEAKVNAFDEEQPEEDPESELIRARDGGVPKNTRGGMFGV